MPAEELDAFLQALDFISEVSYRSLNSEDISANYYDAQGRLETLRLEKDRLNELIAEAADSAELERLDAQLKDVYTQIDALESKLRNFDSPNSSKLVWTSFCAKARSWRRPPLQEARLQEGRQSRASIVPWRRSARFSGIWAYHWRSSPLTPASRWPRSWP